MDPNIKSLIENTFFITHSIITSFQRKSNGINFYTATTLSPTVWMLP